MGTARGVGVDQKSRLRACGAVKMARSGIDSPLSNDRRLLLCVEKDVSCFHDYDKGPSQNKIES